MGKLFNIVKLSSCVSIWFNIMWITICQSTQDPSNMTRTTPLSDPVYYIHVIFVNVYRKDITVITTLKQDPRFEQITIQKGKQFILKGEYPITQDTNKEIRIVAFDGRKAIKINGRNSAVVYLSKKSVITPNIFYIEKRLESQTLSTRATLPSTIKTTSIGEVSSSGVPSVATRSHETVSSKRPPNTVFPTRVVSRRLPSNHTLSSRVSSSRVSSFKATYIAATSSKAPYTSVPFSAIAITKLHSAELLSTQVSPTKSPSNHSRTLLTRPSLTTAFLSSTSTKLNSTGDLSSKAPLTKSPLNMDDSISASFITSKSTDLATTKISTTATPSPEPPLSNAYLTTSSLTKLPMTKPSCVENTPTSLATNVPSTGPCSSEVLATETFSSTDAPKVTSTGRPLTGTFPHGFCRSTNESTSWGIFVWPETEVGSLAMVTCPYDSNANATRKCQYIFRKISWKSIDAEECPYLNITSRKIFNLSKITVHFGNALSVAQQIRSLSFPGKKLITEDIANTATVLENIVAVNGTADEVAVSVFDTIDNILDANSDAIMKSQRLKNSSARMVKSLNTLMENMNSTNGGSYKKTLKNFAVGLSVVDPWSFSGMTFSGVITHNTSASSKNNVIKTTLTNNKHSFLSDETAIQLPQSLFSEATATNVSPVQTIIFVLYKETKFFQVISPNSAERKPKLSSYIISGGIKGHSISNLKHPVTLSYPRLKSANRNVPLCVFWSFSQAGWSDEGCWFESVAENGGNICRCNHLTNFAMLVDMNGEGDTPHDEVLGIISYIGCSLSLIGAALTIVTILLFKDLRDKVPLQILLNFCIALSLTLVVFLAAAERSKTSSMTACRAAAIALHYFVLAVFMWMAISAFNMYLLFVKVLPSYFSRFMLKCCVVAWGVPVVIVSITVSVALDHYGDTKYCRLYGVPFLVSFFAPVVIILLVNSIAFVIIFRSLLTAGSKVTSDQKKNGFQQARQGAAVLLLLGLTWLFGVFAVKDAKLVFQYLFCIFNSLQGLLVFIFYCILPATTRQKYKSILRKKTRSRFGDDRAMFNMETNTWKTTTSRDENRSINSLSRLKTSPAEVILLTDSFDQQREAEA